MFRAGSLVPILRKVRIKVLPDRSIGLGNFLTGRIQVDRGCLEASMPYLFLHDRQGKTSVHRIVHDVAMSQGMDRKHPQVPAETILAIDLLQARPLDIDLENLPDPVFGIGVIPPSSVMK